MVWCAEAPIDLPDPKDLDSGAMTAPVEVGSRWGSSSESGASRHDGGQAKSASNGKSSPEELEHAEHTQQEQRNPRWKFRMRPSDDDEPQ